MGRKEFKAKMADNGIMVEVIDQGKSILLESYQKSLLVFDSPGSFLLWAAEFMDAPISLQKLIETEEGR